MSITQSKPFVFFKDCSSSEKEKLTFIFNQAKLIAFKNEIVVLKINDISEESRIKVRKVVNDKSPFLILLSSNIEVSNFAWQCQADYFVFLKNKNWENELSNFLKLEKLNLKSKYKTKLKIKTHKQIEIIDPVDIVVILAQGNYSELRLICGKKILVTKQVGVLEKELENWAQLERFGKSIIVNLNKITSIKNKTITFKNNEQFSFPKYSRSFVYLKNRLLWNH